MTEVNLAYLMEFIGNGFPFTQERYVNSDLSTPEKALAFAVGHSQKHMAKTTGQIAAETEKHDHGGNMDIESLKVATAKAVVNALNLANALGMTAEEIAKRIPQVMRTA